MELEAVDGKIDPENRTCSLASKTKVACLSLQGCLLYEGEAVTEELGELFSKKFSTQVNGIFKSFFR